MDMVYCDWCEEPQDSTDQTMMTKIMLKGEPFNVCLNCTELYGEKLWDDLIKRLVYR